ncbi:hypothetical protein CL614_08730 [archaeon]|nr:hypothetical protein [archaeon]
MKTRHCIGVLCYCRSENTPDRFKRLKESISSMQSLKRDDNYMFLWDNGSSKDVKEFLDTCDFFDDVFFSTKNLMENAVFVLLNLKAQELNAEFVTFLCDDNMVYDAEAIPHCFEFLKTNPECGYVRVLKYEIDKPHIYDKILKHPDMDVPNAQRHFNTITKKPLTWHHAGQYEKYTFYKNNWHWTDFPNVCRADVFDKIIPKEDGGIMQHNELKMMLAYGKLNLSTGILDGGAITHNQRDFHDGGSVRVSEVCNTSLYDKIIKYDEIIEEIRKVCNED